MVIVPPPLSDLMGAEELPEVTAVTLSAVRVPPPVTMMAPELLAVVVISESEMLTVPSPVAKTALA